MKGKESAECDERKPLARKSDQSMVHQGFTLIEVTLALGIIAFCLVSLIGLFSVGIRSNLDANNRTIVPHIVEQIVSQVRRSSPPPQAGTVITGSFDRSGFPTSDANSIIYNVECRTKDSPQAELFSMEINVTYQGGLKQYYATYLGFNNVSGGATED